MSDQNPSQRSTAPMTSFSEARILVTGAAGGIGSALARRLSILGAELVLTSRSQQPLEALAAELKVDAEATISADLTQESAVASLFAQVQERFGSITALVNIAGGSVPGAVATATVEDYESVWHRNVTATFLTSKHALPLLVDGVGQIVNISSVAGLRPNPTAPLYTTAKAAVDMFSKSLAMQVKDRGIRVSTINPGGTDTPFWGERPVDRATLMSADDVADAITFVLSRPANVHVSSLVIEPFIVPTERS